MADLVLSVGVVLLLQLLNSMTSDSAAGYDGSAVNVLRRLRVTLACRAGPSCCPQTSHPSIVASHLRP